MGKTNKFNKKYIKKNIDRLNKPNESNDNIYQNDVSKRTQKIKMLLANAEKYDYLDFVSTMSDYIPHNAVYISETEYEQKEKHDTGYTYIKRKINSDLHDVTFIYKILK